MGLVALFLGLSFAVLSVRGLYFPLAEVNVSVPDWTEVNPRPYLMKVYTVGGHDVSYSIRSQSTPGLFDIEGDVVRVNSLSLASQDVVSKEQSVVVNGRTDAESADASINLLLTGEKLNCENSKRELCFWTGASYRISLNEPPAVLGQISSPLHLSLCSNYSLQYELYKGNDYVEVDKVDNHWILSTKRKIKSGKSRSIRMGLECRVSSGRNFENFRKEFELTVIDPENFGAFFRILYQPSESNIIPVNERIASGSVANLNGEKLKFSLVNDTRDLFRLNCEHKGFHYECDVTAAKTIHLKSPYTAFIQIEDASTRPHRLHFQNISLHPVDSGLEKLSLMLSTNPEENSLLDLKYPDSVEISRRAVAGTRVAEPRLGSQPGPSSDARMKIIGSGVKFEILNPGIFNVTQRGGIVYVNNRNQLKKLFYRVKVSGTYENGYRFISTMQINVTETPSVVESCEKTMDENLRPSCSEKRSKSDCERTCGVSSAIIKRKSDKVPITIGCSWRTNDKPENLSRFYQTCSPHLGTCPDRFCDPLEILFPKICPQDCTEYVFGSANKENHLPGIASATGVCSCDNRQKCLCTIMAPDTVRSSERRKVKEHQTNDTSPPRQKEAISAVKASYSDQCGMGCLLLIVTGSVTVVCGTSLLLFMVYRRRLKKRCPNQRPLKEHMVNINYEEYVERPGDLLRPLTQSSTVKEIPEYFDKKWEFPRHRLTIEETLGEGEFGKVLKARADGIGGRDGSTTVAVKTLKENAKESEMSDLISEYQLLKDIDHPNVIHLLGACTKLDGPLYIIIEYAKHGSLRNYLRKHRHLCSEKESETITPKTILTFAWQIAKGMSYLTEMKLVHRDLAARNVLVAEGLICKISDFGLTRDIYEDDTYLKRSKGRVPVKWMALESLADHVYTSKSDVWSYGVVLWELVTTGASPYPGIAGQDLFNLLKSGYRMERPANCSQELYQILRSCWQENPSHRPTFKCLVAKFEEMLGEGKDYLDLNPRTAENKTYFSEFLWRETDEKEEMYPLKFKMFEVSCECPAGGCKCGLSQRYENESVGSKRKYENEGMEDVGYVQPTGKPKPVNEIQKEEESNFDIGLGKGEMFNALKI